MKKETIDFIEFKERIIKALDKLYGPRENKATPVTELVYNYSPDGSKLIKIKFDANNILHYYLVSGENETVVNVSSNRADIMVRTHDKLMLKAIMDFMQISKDDTRSIKKIENHIRHMHTMDFENPFTSFAQEVLIMSMTYTEDFEFKYIHATELVGHDYLPGVTCHKDKGLLIDVMFYNDNGLGNMLYGIEIYKWGKPVFEFYNLIPVNLSDMIHSISMLANRDITV